MRSKQISDRQKQAQVVISAGKTHRREIVAGLGARLTPMLSGKEKLPDLDLMVELHVRLLEQTQEALLTQDDAYQQELLDDAAPRQKRDEAATALYGRLVELRELLTGVYGLAAAREAGLSGTTPQDPVQLSRFASQVSKAIGAAKLPKPRMRGASLHVGEVAAELDQLRKTLDQHLADVLRETREAQAALSERKTAQATFDETYDGVSSLIAGLLRLAGKPDLAERVRPTSRRSSSSEAPNPDPSSEPPSTPA